MSVLQRDLTFAAEFEEATATRRTGWARTTACTTRHQFLCPAWGSPLQAIGLQMWRTQSYHLPDIFECKLRSKWAGWGGAVALVLNLCHARLFIRWNSNGMGVVSWLKARPVLEKVSQGFVVFFVLPLGCVIIWSYLLVAMLVQPSLRWEGQTAVELRYVTIIVFAIIRVAWLFCGWRFWMLSVFTSLFDIEHTWNRKMMTSKRNLVFKGPFSGYMQIMR